MDREHCRVSRPPKSHAGPSRSWASLVRTNVNERNDKGDVKAYEMEADRYPTSSVSSVLDGGKHKKTDELLTEALKSRADVVTGKRWCLSCGKCFQSVMQLAQHLKDKHGGRNGPIEGGPGQTGREESNQARHASQAMAARRHAASPAVQRGGFGETGLATSWGWGSVVGRASATATRPGAQTGKYNSMRGGSTRRSPKTSGNRKIPDAPAGMHAKNKKKPTRLKRLYSRSAAADDIEHWRDVLAFIEEGISLVSGEKSQVYFDALKHLKSERQHENEPELVLDYFLQLHATARGRLADAQLRLRPGRRRESMAVDEGGSLLMIPRESRIGGENTSLQEKYSSQVASRHSGLKHAFPVGESSLPDETNVEIGVRPLDHRGASESSRMLRQQHKIVDKNSKAQIAGSSIETVTSVDRSSPACIDAKPSGSTDVSSSDEGSSDSGSFDLPWKDTLQVWEAAAGIQSRSNDMEDMLQVLAKDLAERKDSRSLEEDFGAAGGEASPPLKDRRSNERQVSLEGSYSRESVPEEKAESEVEPAFVTASSAASHPSTTTVSSLMASSDRQERLCWIRRWLLASTTPSEDWIRCLEDSIEGTHDVCASEEALEDLPRATDVHGDALLNPKACDVSRSGPVGTKAAPHSQKPKATFYCSLCDVSPCGPIAWKEHVESKRHVRKLMCCSSTAEASFSSTFQDPLEKMNRSALKVLVESPKQNRQFCYVGQNADVAPYVDHIITTDINATVESFLRRLIDWQERTRRVDPMNFRQKRRFVSGLREAHKFVRVGKAKLLVIAPNIEPIRRLEKKNDRGPRPGAVAERTLEGSSDGFEGNKCSQNHHKREQQHEARSSESGDGAYSPIVSLIELANDNGIPIVFALTRQRLGRLLGANKRASVLAVINASGAELELQSVVNMADEQRAQQ